MIQVMSALMVGANEEALRATNLDCLRRATKIHGDIFVSNAYIRIYLILVGCCRCMLDVVIGRTAPLRVENNAIVIRVY